MEDFDKILINGIDQAVLFNDTQEFSFYFSLDNLVSLHFSKSGHSLLYEIPYNNETNKIFPSHIRPSLLLSYSTNFQNSLNKSSNPNSSSLNSQKTQNEFNDSNINNNINSLKQPTLINTQKTKFILSKYKSIVKEALIIRNIYSPYPYFPLEWIINEKENWFRTNSILEYTHWPYMPLIVDDTVLSNINNNNNNNSIYYSNSYLSCHPLFQKLNITITSNNAIIMQSLDRFVSIKVSPHYQIFKVKYPIYLGKFSNQLFHYTQSKEIYNDSYNGQYVYYYITQEFSIKDIPEWCQYPLWLFQQLFKINLSISNPIEGIEKKDMVVIKLPQISLSHNNEIIQGPPDFQHPHSIKILYTPEAIYRLLPSNEIEIKVNDDETIFRTSCQDMTYLSVYYPERRGQEDIIKWKGMGRTFNSIITNHISNKRYPLQKFLHQALILYQSSISSALPASNNYINNDNNNTNINKKQSSFDPLHLNTNDDTLPIYLYNYGIDEENIIPISPSLSSEIQEHLTIDDNDFWAYADGRVHVVFKDRVIISMKINIDQCEIIQQNGEKITVRLSRPLGFEYYIKISLSFAKWAYSTKSFRETEKLKKIRINNKIKNEIRRNELFLIMTDYSRFQRHINSNKIISHLDNIMGRNAVIQEQDLIPSTSSVDINYMKLSELLTNITEKNKKFLNNSK